MYRNTPMSQAEIKRDRKATRKYLSREELAFRFISTMKSDFPKRWNEFADENFSRVMFYEKIKQGEYIGHCECGAAVTLNQARSGKEIICPSCKWTVLLKDSSRKKGLLSRYDQRECFALLERNGEDIISRLFVGYKNSIYSGGNYVETRLSFYEEERDYLYSNGEIFAFRPIQGSELQRWRVGVGRSHGALWSAWSVGFVPVVTYPDNIADVLKGTRFQYSMLDKATYYNRVNPANYLRNYLKGPKVEMLYKLGLYGVALEYFGNTTTSYEISRLKSPKDIGLVTKEDFETCRYYRFATIKAWSEVKKWKYFKDNERVSISFISILNSRCGEDFEYSFLSREGMFNYYLTQKEVLSGKDEEEKIKNFISDYTDYVSAGCHLNFNFNDTAYSKPKDFKQAHAWAIANDEALETKIYDPQIQAVYDNLHELVEWTDGELSVIMPRTSVEIVEEGVRQDHCVGRYCERVAKGESVILFIRKNTSLQESFYTMEIKPDIQKLEIAQCRGYKNDEHQNPKDRIKVDSFCERYALWFNNRDIGDYENEIKAKYYKAVHKRKDGKYISNADGKTEFKIGEFISAEIESNPDLVHVKGLHIASLQFAQKFGESWKDVAILEVEVDIHDVIVPDALDQVRTSKMKVLREVPMSEMGEWGKKHDTAKAA